MRNEPGGLSEQVVRFVSGLTFNDIPADAVAAQKLNILDVLGAALAGVSAEGIPALLGQVTEWGGRPEASLIGGGGARVPVPLAVLCNATTARALELDNVHEKALVHPTVAVTPVALAVAESQGRVHGRDFLAATIAGEEVLCRLGLSPEYHIAGPKHKPRGWSFTYQCGTLGAALTAGKLLRLSESQLLDGFGNAYTALAGNQQAIQEGVLAVRVQQGLCAQTAVQSAYLARIGITGPRQSLEGVFGWLTFWHGNSFDPNEITGDLGSRWEVRNVSIKPFACCKITHPAITATVTAMRDGELKPEDVERLTVHVNSQESWAEVVHPAERKRTPLNPVDAQFCLPYLCGVALVKGTVALEDLEEPGIRDPRVLAMAQRVHAVMDETAPLEGRVMPCPVTVDLQTKDGRTISRRCEFPRGHPKNPMTVEEIEDKFFTSARLPGRFAERRLTEIRDMVRDLEHLGDVAELSRLLA